MWPILLTLSFVYRPVAPLKGECWEVERDGSYSRKVELSRCRPKKYKLKFIEGTCLEVDSKTLGQKYARKVGDQNCRPQTTRFLWNALTQECFEVGQGDYRKKVQKRSCRPAEIRREFVLDKKQGNRGDCFEVDSKRSNGYRRRVQIKECLPAKVDYRYVKKVCYAVDAKNGALGYIERVDVKYCIRQSQFEFKRTDDLQGQCWEVFDTAQGQGRTQVAKNKCRPEQTVFRFARKKSGQGGCFLIDKNRGADAYIESVSIERCRPSVTKTIPLNGKCVEVDTKTDGKRFYFEVNPKKCERTLGPPRYQPGVRNPYIGTCTLEVMGPKGRVQRRLSVRECEPKGVILKRAWYAERDYRGQCYEVHPKGPHLYSRRIDSKLCRPNKGLEKRFVPKESGIGGDCFLGESRNFRRGYIEKLDVIECRPEA